MTNILPLRNYGMSYRYLGNNGNIVVTRSSFISILVLSFLKIQVLGSLNNMRFIYEPRHDKTNKMSVRPACFGLLKILVRYLIN